MRHLGWEYEVSVNAFYKIAMAKRTDRAAIEEECFDAAKNLYDHETDVKVIDIELKEYTQGDNFTFADICIDLRIKVEGKNCIEACGNAEERSVLKNLPVGVSRLFCEAYDWEKGEERIDYDVVV